MLLVSEMRMCVCVSLLFDASSSVRMSVAKSMHLLLPNAGEGPCALPLLFHTERALNPVAHAVDAFINAVQERRDQDKGSAVPEQVRFTV